MDESRESNQPGLGSMGPTPPQLNKAIREAAQWNLLLQDTALDEAQRRDYQAWLRSALNARELGRICLIDALLHVSLKDQGARKLPPNVISFQSYAPMTALRARESVPAQARRRFRRVKIAAAIAAGLVLAIVGTMHVTSLISHDRDLVTERGHWDKQLLQDGSVVYAGPTTELRFHFDDDMRSVALLRGEAMFDVAKDPDRPFVVATNAGSVKAVGTEFATAYQGDSVVVTVSEGKVAVSPEAAGHAVQPIIPLVANQQLVLSRSGTGRPVAVNAEREVKWIRNWYDFDGEQVCEIVEQLNRRHDVKMVVTDPRVCRLRLNSLAFKPSELDEFVAKINRWYADFPDRLPRNEGVVLRVERH
jgi:transmembrane sensor